MHLTLSQHCSSAILQYKIKSLNGKIYIYIYIIYMYINWKKKRNLLSDNILKAYELNLISPLGKNKNSYLTDKLIRQTQKHKTYPSQWFIFMVTRWSIIGCVYSGKPAIDMLEKTIFRDGENEEQELTHCLWKRKMVQPLSKKVRQFLINIQKSPYKYVSKRNEDIYIHKKTSKQMLAASFIGAQNAKQPKCL